MKKTICFILTIFLAAMLLFTISCKKEEKPTVEEVTTEPETEQYLPTEDLNEFINGDTDTIDPDIIYNHIKNLYREMEKYKKDKKFNPVTYDDIQKINLFEIFYNDFIKNAYDEDEIETKITDLKLQIADTMQLFNKWSSEYGEGPTTNELQALYEKPLIIEDITAEPFNYIRFWKTTDIEGNELTEQQKQFFVEYLQYTALETQSKYLILSIWFYNENNDEYIIFSGSKYDLKGKNPQAFICMIQTKHDTIVITNEETGEQTTEEIISTQTALPMTFKSMQALYMDKNLILQDKNSIYKCLMSFEGTALLYDIRHYKTNTFFLDDIPNYGYTAKDESSLAVFDTFEEHKTFEDIKTSAEPIIESTENITN